jgi:membrane protein YdbS with pleckstrin-like domain
MAGGIALLCTAPWVLIGAVVIALLPMLPIALRWGAPPLLVLLCAAWAWAAWSYPSLRYRHTSYRVDARGIEIRKGVWWRRVQCVPRSRIQHTDVSQGPVERRFGLATLSVFTAGTEYSRISLGGLAHEDALRIRDHLIAGSEGDGV